MLVGEQLVWEQTDPLQEKHRQGPGGSQHVRRQGRGGRSDAWRLARPHDEPGQPVGRQSVLRGRSGLRGRLLNNNRHNCGSKFPFYIHILNEIMQTEAGLKRESGRKKAVDSVDIIIAAIRLRKEAQPPPHF